jgi:RNA polymerase sigma factor (sigma-70 family)
VTEREGSGEQGKLSAKERSALVQGIAALPELQARLIVLHYLREKSLEDIAQILGVTAKVIDQMHYDALCRLRHWNN